MKFATLYKKFLKKLKKCKQVAMQKMSAAFHTFPSDLKIM